MQNSESAGRTIRSHAAGVVLYRLPDPNRLEIAVMNYCRKDDRGIARTTLRVFMGKQGFAEGGRPETFMETLTRELRGEAFDISREFRYENAIRNLVYWELVPDDNEPQRFFHLKGFLGLKFVGGALRGHRLLEHEGTAKEEILDPPQWVEFGELWRRMEPRNASLFTHRKAVTATLHHLAQRDSDLAFRYQDILDATASIVQTAPEHKGLVRAYLESLDEEFSVNGK